MAYESSVQFDVLKQIFGDNVLIEDPESKRHTLYRKLISSEFKQENGNIISADLEILDYVVKSFESVESFGLRCIKQYNRCKCTHVDSVTLECGNGCEPKHYGYSIYIKPGYSIQTRV